ncbi:MAG: YXWGXW repeat-containing protein [Myxococcales bacterium]|nr:YXWGXW repeat-containing protein [Myxococcales bacterium]
MTAIAALSVAIGGCASTGSGGARSVAGGSVDPQARPTITRGPDGLPVDERAMNDAVEGWRSARRWQVRPIERCATSAMEVYVPATEARWARSLRVRVRTPRRLAFHIEVRPPEPSRGYVAATMYGMERAEHEEILTEHGACIAQRASSATASTAAATPATATSASSATTSAGAAGRGRRNTNTTVTTTATVTPAAVPEVIASAEVPLRGFVAAPDFRFDYDTAPHRYGKEFVLEREFAVVPMNYVHRSWVPRAELSAAYVLRIWTQEPLDTEGVVFEVEDLVLEPRIAVEEYTRLWARRVAAASVQQQEFTELCRREPTNERCYHTTQNQQRYVGARRPPPPPRDEAPPPRPSSDHLWVSGGWQWNGSDYAWISGMWRFVPPPIVAQTAGSTGVAARPAVTPAVATTTVASASTTATATTTRAAPSSVATFTAPTVAVVLPNAAPTAPPPRAEVIPPAPQAGAQWIAGYWQWNGSAWAWTTGHWELPPQVNVRWAPPALQVGAGGVQLFLPGGWLRIGP